MILGDFFSFLVFWGFDLFAISIFFVIFYFFDHFYERIEPSGKVFLFTPIFLLFCNEWSEYERSHPSSSDGLTALSFTQCFFLAVRGCEFFSWGPWTHQGKDL